MFFNSKFKIAFEKRTSLAEISDAFRLIYGENDFLPGLIIDIYNEVAVIKLYSTIWIPYLSLISAALNECLKLKAQVLRFSRQVNEHSIEYGLEEGMVIFGKLETPEIIIHEKGVRFYVNVIKGHKTGFFLDHRRNRIQVGKISKALEVLDVFCYAGGFSNHALSNGAKSVTSIDISKQAIQVAKKNAGLNEYSGIHNCLIGDAFDILEDLMLKKAKFDLIIIDPPSFAKSKSEIITALKQYERLAYLGSQLVKDHGLLLLASCSSRIKIDQFKEANESGLSKSNKRYFIWKESGHDVDHPIEMLETSYLKSIYYQFDN